MGIFILILILMVIASLAYSLYLMMSNKQKNLTKFNTALKLRVGISMLIIIIILGASFLGKISLHGVGQFN